MLHNIKFDLRLSNEKNFFDIYKKMFMLLCVETLNCYVPNSNSNITNYDRS